MDLLFDELSAFIRGHMVDGIMSLYEDFFDAVNSQVSQVAGQMSTSPSDFTPGVLDMIRGASETAIFPIAGIILTFVACYELIQLVVANNNLANLDTWIFFKWFIKTAIAVMLITHCFDLTLAVFDMTCKVCRDCGSYISGSTAITPELIENMRDTLNEMSVGSLIVIFFEYTMLGTGFKILSLLIFVIVYGRMIEIYLLISMAPIPFSTFGNKEMSHIGQNYVKSLLAIGFQGFLILLVIGIYAVLIQNMTISDDISESIWSIMGYTILLAFSLFKTGTLSKRIFTAQ